MIPNTARRMAQRKIPATKCARCGRRDVKLERHHHDYSKPMDVIVLCCKCHRKEDQKLGKIISVKKVKCVVCGVVYQPKRSRRSVLCGSSKCRIVYGRSSALRRWTKKDTTRLCECCGKIFIPKRSRMVTCGRSCGNKMAWLRRKDVDA